MKGIISSGRTRVACGKIITGLFVFSITSLIFSVKLRFSLETLFLFTEIESIFLKYQPNIGIFNSSFLRIKIGELKIVCKKKFQT